MRVLIVDDEPAARARIASLLEEIDPQIEIVGEAADGEQALVLARERIPDVIMLDISMREVDGFDVARHLPHPRPLVIFQTAYHEHALRAFEHEALDFVVKPVKIERLAQAIERARERLSTLRQAATWDASTLERLGAAIGHQPGRPARLLVRHGAGHRLVALRDVTHFTARDGLVYARSASGDAVADYTLVELEARLRGMFIRVSRADLVNHLHVERIAGGGDGSATLTLTGGTNVHVSRRRAAAVRSQLES
jgi:DNA-binding LytR/AlgR family response regulator